MIFFILAFFTFLPLHSIFAFSFDGNVLSVVEDAKESFYSASSSAPKDISRMMSQIFTADTWDRIKTDAKEEAGIDLMKFFRWLLGALAKLFSWLAAFLSGLAPH